MDEETLIREELIGRHVIIRECTDPQWNDKMGIIIDETKNTFLIEIDNKCKRIVKNTAKFEFEDNEKKTILNGSRLTYRPEDRIKKAR
jgi:RNase P/RNase MRP subunit p29